MPRTETVLTIFVASPGDVSDERMRMEEIVREVNLTVGESQGVRLELIKWETNTFPSANERSQQAINLQIGDKYDIFVGIMWGRFGSSTGAYDSGTEEEFSRAKHRYDSGDELDIMFYFKDEPIPPSKIDIEQLSKVKQFQSAVGEAVYYRTFNTVGDFEKLFRVNIARKISDYSQSGSVRPEMPSNAKALNAPSDFVEEEDEVGFLDMHIQLEEATPRMTKVVERIGERTNWIAAQLNKHTEAAKSLTDFGFGVPNARDAAKLVDASASDLQTYASALDSINEEFALALDVNFKTIAGLASFYKSLPDSQAGGAMRDISAIKQTIEETRAQMTEFRTSVAALPRMTSRLNAAKRHVVRAIDRIVSELALATKLLDDALE